MVFLLPFFLATLSSFEILDSPNQEADRQAKHWVLTTGQSEFAQYVTMDKLVKLMSLMNLSIQTSKGSTYEKITDSGSNNFPHRITHSSYIFLVCSYAVNNIFYSSWISLLFWALLPLVENKTVLKSFSTYKWRDCENLNREVCDWKLCRGHLSHNHSANAHSS